ncbi:MAG: 3-oxoacyl-[acyl-carrier-protein] reductase FabG [Alphaproteobacteria bacterium MarineAlpha4_Bin2]|nr:MAG: 3-oxoacyl-[acyl-carrier-protein] reductase FabG [Alphaproteobacteria bacterium MarineAlpha4_Bin2]
MERITLVTGGSRGIGAATAHLCASEGHAVAINYQNDFEAAERVRTSIVGIGGNAVVVQGDTGVESEIISMFETVDSVLGPVTGLVNNAGVHGPRGRLDALGAQDISRVLDVNVAGYFVCAREAVKRMSTKYGGKGGAIVNVSSGSARLGGPGEGVLYAASKGAVNSLTIGLSQEVVGEGIRVNTVAPGLTVTDMPPRDKLDKLGANIPIGRAAQPVEIAEAIVWLLSEKASYTAGANIRVGGGRI